MYKRLYDAVELAGECVNKKKEIKTEIEVSQYSFDADESNEVDSIDSIEVDQKIVKKLADYLSDSDESYDSITSSEYRSCFAVFICAFFIVSN